jgi:hypothetical protein
MQLDSICYPGICLFDLSLKATARAANLQQKISRSELLWLNFPNRVTWTGDQPTRRHAQQPQKPYKKL